MDRQLLWSKKEVTYGTDSVAAAANTVLAENVSHQLMGSNVTPNTAKPGVGPDADHVYGRHVRLGWDVALAGHTTLATAPVWGPMMKASGWQEALVDDEGEELVTYSLRADPSASDSMTHVWRDSLRGHKVRGWRGRIGLSLTAGQRPMLKPTGLGLYDPVVAAAALVHADADFDGWNDTAVVASGTTTFEFDGVAGLGIREVTLEQSETVKFTDIPEQQNVQILGSRVFTGQMKFTAPPVGTMNFETRWVGGAIAPFTLIHQATPDSIVTVLGRVQIVGAPAYSREDDQDVVSFGVKCVPSSRTTDDELAIILTWAA